jgi:hypothetical protein
MLTTITIYLMKKIGGDAKDIHWSQVILLLISLGQDVSLYIYLCRH